MKKFFKNIAREIVKGALYIYFKVVYKAEIKGLNNIPKEGALVFCGNHRSFLDAPLMMATNKRFARFMAKEDLRKNKFLAFLAIIFDAIYVKRDSKDLLSIKEALKTLKQGGCIAIYPEGTRNGLEKGEKVKDGAAFLALRSAAKVLPVGISGGEKAFKKMTINYGEAIDFSKYKNEKQDKDVLDKVTKEIMDTVLLLTKKEN